MDRNVTGRQDMVELPRKRRKLSVSPNPDDDNGPEPPTTTDEKQSWTNLAEKNVAPFLSRHIRDHKAPMNGQKPTPEMALGSRYCYRHRPDLKCRRQADEMTMDQMQQVGSWRIVFRIPLTTAH
jgi:F-box/WD-40 domain protein MET30